MKSKEFVLDIIKSGRCKGMDIEDFENPSEHNFKKTATQYTGLNTFNNVIHGENGKTFEVNIIHDPEADFEYFTTETCRCDGTATFLAELYSKIVTKLLNAETYYTPGFVPKSDDDVWNYGLNYIVGDFVFNNEYDEKRFGTKEKPWLYSRWTVMLPIKCEWVKK